MVLLVLSLLTLPCRGPSVDLTRDCGDQKFYQRNTDTCEPCGVLCDPPGVYETECPKRCPHYTPPTTTSTRTPDPGNPSPDPGLFTSLNIFIIIISILVFIISTTLIVCVIVKYKVKLRTYLTQCCSHLKLSVEEKNVAASSDTDANTNTPLVHGNTIPVPDNIEPAFTDDLTLNVDGS